jgi:hypothetical protein
METDGVSTFRQELEQAGIEVISPEQAGGSTVVWFYGLSPPEGHQGSENGDEGAERP